MKLKLKVIMTSALIAIFAVACGGGDGAEVPANEPAQEVLANEPAQEVPANEPAQEEASNDSTAKEKSSEHFKDGILDTQDERIEITNVEVLPAGALSDQYRTNENPVVLFEYDFTNKKDEPRMPDIRWIWCITPTQETETTIENLSPKTISGDATYGDKFEMGRKKVKPGATVSAAASYEILFPGEPVIVQVSKGVTENVGSFIVETDSLV